MRNSKKRRKVGSLDSLCLDMLKSDLELYGMTLKQAKEIAKKISK